MATWNTGEKNGMWRGGRIITSDGYIMIRVGKDHHLADCRGYAYEHRLVWEESNGRRLRPGELVHHKDDDPGNNAPDNLKIMSGHAEHRFEHRSATSNLRIPGEENPKVECLCGCKEELDRFDSVGRPRDYVSGHNPMPSPTFDAIHSCLSRGPIQRRKIAEETGIGLQAVAVSLSKMRRAGLAAPISHGVWTLVATSQEIGE